MLTGQDININLTTVELIKKIQSRFQPWILHPPRIAFIKARLIMRWYYKINHIATLEKTRIATKELLDYITTDMEIESESGREFWGYLVQRPEGKNYTVVKKPKGRKPGIKEWSTCDDYTPIPRLFPSGIIWGQSKQVDQFTCIIRGLCSTGLMHSVFNPTELVDVSSYSLPKHDIKARLGDEYTMLFDNAMQEWRIWRKD